MEFFMVKGSEHIQLIECGWCNTLRPSYGVHTHHIDGNRRNNNSKNLVTLCPKCHRKVHRFSKPKTKVPKGHVLIKRIELTEMLRSLEKLLDGVHEMQMSLKNG